MHTFHPLPRPVALAFMLGLLLMMPLGLYLAVWTGTQPAADFLTQQVGGSRAVVFREPFVNLLAALGAVVGIVVDLRMIFET